MCNDYRLKVDAATIGDVFAELKITLRFPEGVPNIQPRDDIRITDTAPIVRAAAGEPGAAELVQRRWSWPAPNKKPVYNFRSEGREFASERCLILADGFYEFTAPADAAKKLKDKWLFTKADEPLFCVAGIWRSVPELGEAFTMLTMAPGPDVAPYHDRQIAVLDRRDWSSWLNPSVPAADVLRPLPAGSLRVERVA
jgi:putative SOS response-associated peptidase YedK